MKFPGKDGKDVRHLLAALALCALALLAYSNSFSSGFVLDNKGLILQDPRIRAATGENFDLILQHTYWWPYGESGLYRPLTTLSYLFNYAILGNSDRPAAYHWLNFLLHCGNILLVYALALRFTREFWPSVFVAALWAVHPAGTEAVTNIVGRADLLAGLAMLGGFLMYLKSMDASGAWRWAWLAGLAVTAAAGVFSKESAAVLIGIIALYEVAFWRERKRAGALLLGCLAVAPALQAMWYQRAAVFAAVPRAEFPLWDNPLAAADFWTARLTAIKVIARYLAVLVWPAHLSCDYSYSQIPLFSGSRSDWLSCLAVALTAVFAAVMFRRNRSIFFVVCAAFLALLPASNLLVPIGTIMAERLLYIPSVAFAFCLVAGAYAGARRAGAARVAPFVLVLIAAAFAIRTWTRNADWQTDLTLAAATVSDSPASYKAHMMLAGALYDSDPEHGNMRRVLDEAEKSLAILDSIPDARNNPGSYRLTAVYYFAHGDLLRKRGPDGGMISPPDALRAYRRSVELALRSRSIVRASNARSANRAPDPREADLDRMISATWLRLTSPEKAQEAALAAVRIEPFNPASHGQLAAALSAAGRADDAAVALMEGVLLTSDPNLRQGLLALYSQGLDTKGCATIPGRAGVPALNPSCGIVRTHLCAASIASIRLGLESGRRDISEQVKVSALRDFGCPAAPLDAALAR